jgi:hypothetical protein
VSGCVSAQSHSHSVTNKISHAASESHSQSVTLPDTFSESHSDAVTDPISHTASESHSQSDKLPAIHTAHSRSQTQPVSRTEIHSFTVNQSRCQSVPLPINHADSQ